MYYNFIPKEVFFDTIRLYQEDYVPRLDLNTLSVSYLDKDLTGLQKMAREFSKQCALAKAFEIQASESKLINVYTLKDCVVYVPSKGEVLMTIEDSGLNLFKKLDKKWKKKIEKNISKATMSYECLGLLRGSNK